MKPTFFTLSHIRTWSLTTLLQVCMEDGEKYLLHSLAPHGALRSCSPSLDFSFPSGKIMERLPHVTLMPTPTTVPRAASPLLHVPSAGHWRLAVCTCCGHPCWVAPWGPSPAQMLAGFLHPCCSLPRAAISPSVRSTPLLSSALQALTQGLQRELLWS